MNKLKKFIRIHKAPLPHLAKNNVVYKISCKECDAMSDRRADN